MNNNHYINYYTIKDDYRALYYFANITVYECY